MERLYFYYKLISAVLDLILLNCSLLFTVIFIKGYGRLLSVGERYFYLLLLFNFAWIISSIVVSRREDDRFLSLGKEMGISIIRILLLTSVISVLAFMIKEQSFSRIVVYGTIIIFAGVRTLAFFAFRAGFLNYLKKGAKKTNIVIIGAGETGKALHSLIIKHMDYALYRLAGFLDDDPDLESDMVIGKVSGLNDIVIEHDIKAIFVAMPDIDEGFLAKIADTADYHGIRLKIVPFSEKMLHYGMSLSKIGGIPVIDFRTTPLDNHNNQLIKRLFDLFLSVIVLLLSAPLIILIGTAIKLSSRGPVFYTAERTGYNGRVFRLFKLRTMHYRKDHDDAGSESTSTVRDDPRIFPLGRLIRRLNLDELPQFYNVLKGEMSIVGPRPHRVSLDRKLQDEIGSYMLRYYVKPGITGWAQVNGWRGPTETEEQKKKRIEHDLWYIGNWSFWIDIRIIAKTIFSRKSWRNAF